MRTAQVASLARMAQSGKNPSEPGRLKEGIAELGTAKTAGDDCP
jgi:hypothetical protein